MKKILALLLASAMAAGILTGCAGVPVALEAPGSVEEPVKEEVTVADGTAVKTGLSVVASQSAENASAEANGTITTDVSVIAVTVDDSGVIDSCVIDAVQGKIAFDAEGQLTADAAEILSKNELGENYGMKQFSPIGKEWNEQAAAVAAYAEGKTVEELKSGATDDADLLSSATIYIGGFISGIEDAVNQAAHLGAVKGDELVLTTINSGADSSSATAEAEGSASVTANIAAVTFDKDVITSCIIDSVQSKAAFGTDGSVIGEVSASVPSKNQLGEAYGMKKFSGIGKEWNEQAAAFCSYVTGKTAEEVAGIALTETTAPADADLSSSVSISIAGFMGLVEKAANAETSENEPVKTGYAISATRSSENAGEKDGTATTDIALTAVTVNADGVIESCVIDAIQGKVSFGADGQLTSEPGEVLSKNELGDNYGMRAFSGIGKEWNEQAAAVAAYAVGKTADDLLNQAIDATGAAIDADLTSSATIYVGSMIHAIADAAETAQELGANSGDRLLLASVNSSSGSAATEEADGNAQVDANVIVMTMDGDVITSCIIDAVQSKTAFDTKGAVVGDAEAAVLSKNQLGEAYGMKQFSGIGKEWNEQAAAFCEYVTGKTAEEVAGTALTETTAPADADLSSSVSISIAGFMGLVEKAAK